MKLIQKIHDGRLVLELRGDFDAYAAEPFRQHVETLVAQGWTKLDVDLRQVRFIGTRALSALLAVQRSLRCSGGELHVAQMSEVVRWTLATLGVGHLLVAERQAA